MTPEFDHNFECLTCDGLGEHEPDCDWVRCRACTTDQLRHLRRSVELSRTGLLAAVTLSLATDATLHASDRRLAIIEAVLQERGES